MKEREVSREQIPLWGKVFATKSVQPIKAVGVQFGGQDEYRFHDEVR